MFLKLVSGEEIVGYLSVPSDINPFMVASYFTSTGVPIMHPKELVGHGDKVGLGPWCKFSGSKKFIIPMEHIIHMNVAPDEITRMYDHLVGSTLRAESLTSQELNLARGYGANTEVTH